MFRILIVDDNRVNLEITSRMLQKAGYGVDTASSGEEGVAMARRWRYDLIVMDMSMPGLSGSEAARAIRIAEKASGMRRVPIIAFTANTMEETRRHAMRSDMDDFIGKPIERWQLLAAVTRSLDDSTVVLVADDCAQDRDRMARYLRTMDRIGVVTAATGAEAIAACSCQRVTFALMNTNLPDISGLEAAKRIRESKSGEEIGFVSVGDKSDQRAEKHSIMSWNIGYLKKPITRSDIKEVLQPLLPRS